MSDTVAERRGRRHFAWATLANYVPLTLQSALGLVTVPIGIRAFGLKEYGVWLTLQAFAGYLVNGEMGVGYATLTATTHARTRDDVAAAVAHGVRVVTGTAASFAALLGLVWLAAPHWPERLFSSGASSTVVPTAAVLSFGVLLTLPLTVFPSALAGLQRTTAERLYAGLQPVLRMAVLIVVTSMGRSITTLAVGTVLADLVALVAPAVHLLRTERLHIGRLLLRRAPSGKPLIRVSARYLALQLQYTLIWNADKIVIAAILGSAAVATYGVVQRVVQAVHSLLNAVHNPLWPALGRAYGNRDWERIRRLHAWAVRLALAGGGAVIIGLLLTVPPILRLALGSDFPVNRALIAWFGAVVFVQSYSGANNLVPLALGRTRWLVTAGGAEAALNLGLSIVLAHLVGMTGVAAGTAVAAATTSLWIIPLTSVGDTGGEVQWEGSILLLTVAYTLPFGAAAFLLASTNPDLLRVAAWIAVLVAYGALTLAIHGRALIDAVPVSLQRRLGPLRRLAPPPEPAPGSVTGGRASA